MLPAYSACQAGLDVYVEKPLSLYVAEGRALVRAARKYSRVVQTGTQQRTMEMDRFACELVRDGGIGKVRWWSASTFGGPIPYRPAGFPKSHSAGVNWDLWQGPAPAHPFNKLLFAHGEKLGDWWGMWRDYSAMATDHVDSHAPRHGAVRHGRRRERARSSSGRSRRARPAASTSATPTASKCS